VGEDPGQDTRRKLSVSEAADALGVTVDAIRSRVKRRTIEHVREGGRVWVLLGTDQHRPGHDQGDDRPGESTTLISQMQGRIDSLERQLEEANERDRENRRIIAALTSRIPAIESPPDERQSPETVEEEPDRAEPHPDAPGAQETSESIGGRGSGTARGSLWRRLFGR
jgi:hypothetical protein